MANLTVIQQEQRFQPGNTSGISGDKEAISLPRVNSYYSIQPAHKFCS